MICYLEHINIPNDLGIIYKMMLGEDQYLYSTKLSFSTQREFENWFLERLEHEFHDFYLVKSLKGKDVVGYVHNYDFSLQHQHCKLVVYIVSRYRASGIGGMAACLFIKNLFRDYPLVKVYSTIYDYNKESLSGNFAAGFEEEGVLADYRYYDGQYHSIHYLSMSREKFLSNIGKWVK